MFVYVFCNLFVDHLRDQIKFYKRNIGAVLFKSAPFPPLMRRYKKWLSYIPTLGLQHNFFERPPRLLVKMQFFFTVHGSKKCFIVVIYNNAWWNNLTRAFPPKSLEYISFSYSFLSVTFLQYFSMVLYFFRDQGNTKMQCITYCYE